MPIPLPALVAHCDWGLPPDKRWMAFATLRDGVYFATAPEPVGELSTLLGRLRERNCRLGSILVGFDFPLGLPEAYATKTGVSHFPSFLHNLESDSPFFAAANDPEEISLNRPFYPRAPGGRLRVHLEKGLGIEFAKLFRICDQAHNGRSAAGALFWTMGAKQVGKGALVGWRDVLVPGLRTRQVKLWPFDGQLTSLLQGDGTIAAETYPTEYYRSLFGALIGAKTNQAVRAEAGPRILQWVGQQSGHLHLTQELEDQIQRGFDDGDDAFDAVIGLLGMIGALRHWGAYLEPQNKAIRNIEGWILGQPIHR